ncbi:hypothetical protein [Streptomyces pseudovenezuelae]|uniref:hypothetical protein n=1 Tax=Streptomyces pseudovenezuelae TaxID=67350 RepID=UPI0036ECB473
MSPDESLESASDDQAVAELLRALRDPDSAAARLTFVTALRDVLVNIEDWIAIDSWIGGGKITESRSHPDPSTLSAFRGVAAVICMSAELTDAAVAMTEARRYYAVGATLRQLIECEYLLVLFGQDFDQARRWFESTPEQARRAFTPSGMRKLTGFANHEYWEHCSTGGHPAPKGIRLLEKMDPRRRVWPIAAAEVQMDLGLHLHRIWSASDRLLAQHHARYEAVRASQRQQAQVAWETWLAADPAAAAFVSAWDDA